MEDQLEKLIYKYALLNAVKHKGHAQRGAVVGVIMASHPEFRSDAQKVIKLTAEIIEAVNSMTLDEQNLEMKNKGIHKAIKERKTEEKGLVDLPNVEGEVVLRFAPNPSGPLHIGHARAVILNHEYIKRYGGKLILRLEDTDPRRVDPKAYQMIEEDLTWLGVKWDEKIIQSSRISIYHQYAEKLIELGQAYMCTCPGDEFKKLKDQSQACSCRDLSINDNLKRWKDMPFMSEGEAVLRVKTDINHKNPAIRDWVAMRIVDFEHPLIGTQYNVYPMMNFAVTVDDHLQGISHVLRGKDHLANSEKQKYLYHHFGWTVPEFIHYGRLKMEDVALSTSQARKGINDGVYTGWDDPRLGTLRAIAKRGIKKEALEELMLEIGVKIADTTITWKKIYGLNRNLLEEEANRYFAVFHPKKVTIKDLPESFKGVIKRLKHPDFPDRGYRSLLFDGIVYLDQTDLNNNENKVLRLMDSINIIFKDGRTTFHSSSLEEARKYNAQIIQWVPTISSIDVELVMPDNSILKGLAEPSIEELNINNVVQLERVGFARLDEIQPKRKFYFAHK
ncbi:MAG: glutamate--tRNA ligase [Methanobacterium sp.]